MSQLPAFSRPSRSTGFGKNLAIAKTMIPPEAKSALEGRVRKEGFDTLSDWLREVCIAKWKGISTLRSVADQRLASVAEIVPEKDR